MIYKGKGGLQYDLAPTPLAAGGEGEIYNVNGQPNIVAKIYKLGKTSVEKERKLVKMVDFPPDKSVLSQIAWPQDVLYNAGQFVGFIMPKMNINEDLNVVYEYGSSAKYPHMPWDNRLIIAQNLCAVLDCVHAAGHTCGDFNPKNISVNPNTGHIMFLDTDSYHIQDGSDTLRCDVGIPEYLPAEVQVKMRGGGTLATAKLPTFSHDTDNFALAIHIFQLLMNGVHPFACAIIPSQSSVTAPQPSDNIIKGEFPFMQNIPGVEIPAYAPKITILPQEMQDLFERAFIDGHLNPSIRPTPIEWHKALHNLRGELKNCINVAHHQYYKNLSKCPWCEVNNTFAQSFQPKATLTQTTINIPVNTPNVTAPTIIQKQTLQQKKNPALQKKVIAALIFIILGISIFSYIFFIKNNDLPTSIIGRTNENIEMPVKTTDNTDEKILPDARHIIHTDNNYITIAAGANYSMAIKEDGSLWTWGSNFNGQSSDIPVKVMDDVISISAGSDHAMAIKSDNTLWGWGYNWYGQVGVGKSTANNWWDDENIILSPVKIMESVISVSAGESFTMAIKDDGSLWTWGSNWSGQIGDGTVTTYDEDNHRYTPVKIMDSVLSVSAGTVGQYMGANNEGGYGAHAMAIKTDGSLWGWGDNSIGQLGDGTVNEYDEIGNVINHKSVPVKIMDSVVSVSSGAQYTMAIKTDGSLWAWGSNWYGQLGNGTIESNNYPVKILDSVVSVSAGQKHTMVIKTDKSLWVWGYNECGQLGDGTVTTYDENWNIIDNNKHTPIKIMDNISEISAGISEQFSMIHRGPFGSHSMALKTDGSLWVWGENWSGQIGDGTSTKFDWDLEVVVDNNRHVPVKILDGVKLPNESSSDIYASNPTSESNIANFGSMSIKGDRIYYTVGKGIYSIQLDGSDKHNLTDDKASNIYMFGNQIFYNDWNGKVYSIGIDGNNKHIFIEDNASIINVIDNRIYYITYSENDQFFNELYSINIDGSNKRKLTDGFMSSEPLSNIKVIGERIYYMNHNENNKNEYGIYRINIDGSDKRKLTAEWLDECRKTGFTQNDLIKTYDEMPAPDTDTFPFENQILRWMACYVFVSGK